MFFIILISIAALAILIDLIVMWWKMIAKACKNINATNRAILRIEKMYRLEHPEISEQVPIPKDDE